MSVRLALVGAPNSGKSTLFNGLTGGRAKVANYPGVTVETRAGRFTTPAGHDVELLDLPGVYGLSGRSTDERVALDVLGGRAGAAPPDALVAIVDAPNLRTHLHTVLQMKALGRPMVVALTMIDLAERDGVVIDIPALEARLGAPVAAVRATRRAGRDAFLARLDDAMGDFVNGAGGVSSAGEAHASSPDLKSLQREARAIADAVILQEPALNRLTRAIDAVALHPLIGPLALTGVLFFMFQAVYSWSAAPMDAIDAGVAAVAQAATRALPPGWFASLVTDGVIAGVGAVVIFLPQILILFAFILLLEASGYLARAAFLADGLMRRAGLSGRAVIPLLSSFACAIPGIMAARTIDNERDRLATIMVAPLMTCSAQIQVYALMIAAFIPPTRVGPFGLQGLTLFGLYLIGVATALVVAFVFKRAAKPGPTAPLILELPRYKLPSPRHFAIQLWARAAVFLRQAGTMIFVVSITLWVLVSFPDTERGLRASAAGIIAGVLEPILKPIGFHLEMIIALIPGFAAREVAIGALATVYAVEADEEDFRSLADVLAADWSLATAYAFLAWYVFAPQCLATLAVAKRETNSWAWAGVMFSYLLTLAYLAAGATYQITRALTGEG